MGPHSLPQMFDRRNIHICNEGEMKTKNIGCVRLICVALVLVFFHRSAESAGVVLRLDSFNKLCKVEISKRPSDEHALNRVVFVGPVDKGWTYESHDADYLCYRRSSDPHNCWSMLTDYRCLRWTMDGQINFPLQ